MKARLPAHNENRTENPTSRASCSPADMHLPALRDDTPCLTYECKTCIVAIVIPRKTNRHHSEKAKHENKGRVKMTTDNIMTALLLDKLNWQLSMNDGLHIIADDGSSYRLESHFNGGYDDDNYDDTSWYVYDDYGSMLTDADSLLNAIINLSRITGTDKADSIIHNLTVLNRIHSNPLLIIY